MSDGAWIILIGSLVGVSCSLVGVFLVLRRMSMLGDAMSHSVLFGIAAAFLLSGSRSPLIMFLGAGAVGLFTAYLSNALHRRGGLHEDSSIGVTFTTLFALGVLLISWGAGQVDLDQDCVLHGEIAFAPLDTLTIGARDFGPRVVWSLGAVTLINILILIFGYRALSLISFDPLLAGAMGVNVVFWHYLLMGAVSLTTVASFEAVGAILVVAMLVVPANAAFLLAKRLPTMIALAVVFSLLSSLGGYELARFFDASISAAIALVGGIILIISLIVSKISRKTTSLMSSPI